MQFAGMRSRHKDNNIQLLLYPVGTRTNTDQLDKQSTEVRKYCTGTCVFDVNSIQRVLLIYVLLTP